MKYIAVIAAIGTMMGLSSPIFAQDENTKKNSLSIVCQEARSPGQTTGCPEIDDILPNAETAYTVGIAVLKARYGSKLLQRYMPYEVRSRGSNNDEWCLGRRYPKGVVPPKGGGHPEICLLKRDGRVIRIGLAA